MYIVQFTRQGGELKRREGGRGATVYIKARYVSVICIFACQKYLSILNLDIFVNHILVGGLIGRGLITDR